MRPLALPTFALLLLGAALPAPAQEATPEEIEEALQYAWSNAMFTMYHEVGHMFVDQFQIPMLAREEDAADNLATLMVLQDFEATGDRILEDAAYGWALSEAWAYEEIEDSWFAGVHSLDQQRAYAMVCLMVGSDPETFGPVADDWEMEPERQESCAWDYMQAAASWDAVLEPHLKEPEAEGDLMITVIYDEPEAGYEEMAAFLQETEILETAAARVEAVYVLPAPVDFRAAMCGQDNAFYDSSVPEVVLCYEHAQAHFDRYLADMATWSDADWEEEEAEE